MARKAQADVLAEIERARTHGEAPNLRGWNLSVRRLRDIDLTGADLTNANLHGAQFEKVNLTGATLENADLRKARFGDSRGLTPHQLLDTHGLSQWLGTGPPPDIWNALLPKDPNARELTERLLQDWDGTLREAITTAEELRAA